MDILRTAHTVLAGHALLSWQVLMIRGSISRAKSILVSIDVTSCIYRQEFSHFFHQVELPDTTFLQRTGPQLVKYECTGLNLPSRGLAARYSVRQQCRDPAIPASTADDYNVRVSLICEGKLEVDQAAQVWGEPAPLNNVSVDWFRMRKFSIPPMPLSKHCTLILS